MLVDQHPITDPSELPDWIPSQRDPLLEQTNNVKRILLNRESHSFEVAIRIVAEGLSRDDSEIIIVDPALEKNRHKWEQLLGEIGVCMERRRGTSFIPSHRSLDTIPSEIRTRGRRLLAREPQSPISPNLDSSIRGNRRTSITSGNLPSSRL